MLKATNHNLISSVAREILRTDDPARADQLLQTYADLGGMRNTNSGRRYIRADMRLVKSRESAIESFRNT